MATVNVGGVSYTTNSSTPYMDAYKNYVDKMNQSRESYRGGVNEQLAKDKASANKQYDNSARQSYVQYMQNSRALPSQLNSVGVNGGASESAMLRLGTAYGNNIASNEASRGTALANLDNTAANTLANYDTSYNENLANAYATAHENQIKYTQELQQRDLQNYASSINGRYTTTAEYDAEIARLRKLGVAGDANANEKIALAQQARSALAQQLAEKAATAYRSGGSGGYSSYSGGGSSNNVSSDYARAVAAKATANVAKAASKNTTKSKQQSVLKRLASRYSIRG